MIKKIYDWFERHDKISHFLMAFGFCFTDFIFPGKGIYISVGIMIAIEIYQIIRFGIKGRVKDTVLDLVADAIGIGLYLLIDWLLFAIIISFAYGIF